MQLTFLPFAAAVALCTAASPTVWSQDYLGTHLDTLREENLRRHQQEQLTTSAQDSERYEPPISGPARHAAMRRHHRQYAEVMKEKGVEAADQWLADQVAAGR